MRKWSVMLGAAAAYNLLVAVPSFFLPGAGLSDRIVALLVGCFGLVYALVARDPLRLAPVLWAGVAGKIGVVALMAPAVRAGLAAPGTGWILLGDALFTVLFLLFLVRPGHASPA
jgi:hypothetical protein